MELLACCTQVNIAALQAGTVCYLPVCECMCGCMWCAWLYVYLWMAVGGYMHGFVESAVAGCVGGALSCGLHVHVCMRLN